MAIAVFGGRVQRAIDFYNKLSKYFVIGGTEPWIDETSPDEPQVTDYKLKDVIGYKKVDNCYLVVPDENGSIKYRTQSWRIVPTRIDAVVSTDVPEGSSEIIVSTIAGMVNGTKLRINNEYVGTITDINITQKKITLDTPAPHLLKSNTTILGGALVEGAHYVYVDCHLNYDQFPLATYRQIGLSTEVMPSTANILKSAIYTDSGVNEYTSEGVLEVIDNREPNTRNIDKREILSLVLEF